METLGNSGEELRGDDRKQLQKMGRMATMAGEVSSDRELLNECSETVRGKWGRYEQMLADAKERYAEQKTAVSLLDRDDVMRLLRADRNELEGVAREVLRALTSQEEGEKFGEYLAQRYSGEDKTSTIVNGINLSAVAQTRQNYDPMLEYSLRRASKSEILRTDRGWGTNEAVKMPARAFVKTLSAGERVACGVDKEIERLKRAEREFDKVLGRVDGEVYDVAWECRELALADEYDELVAAYATMSYYASARDFNRQEIEDKLWGRAEYEEERDEFRHTSKVEFNELVNEDVLYSLPDESERKMHYDDIQRILHTMHQLYPQLHSDAMLNYAQICAVMTFGREDAEKVYAITNEYVPGSLEFGLTGKDAAPEEIGDFLYQVANRYKDVSVTDVSMGWLNSHQDNGSSYDYSVPESVQYSIASTNQESLKWFMNDVNAEGEEAVQKILAARKAGKRAKFQSGNW